MSVIRVVAVVASWVLFFACGPASADVGNPLTGVSRVTPPFLNSPQMPKASSLVSTTNPAPSVNPRDVEPLQAAKPYAARPACCSIHAASGGSRGRVGTARGIPPSCIITDGNTGRCMMKGRMSPPRPGIPVGTTSDPGPQAQRPGAEGKLRRAARPYAAKPVCYGMHPVSAGSGGRVGNARGVPYAGKPICYGMRPVSAGSGGTIGTARGVPPNCITIDGNTGRCITNGQMPPPPPGVPVGTTSDPGP